MTKIRALRQFSHYHAGNFSQFETREVKDEYAEALVGMELAEVVGDVDPGQATVKTPIKKTGAKK